MYTLTGHYSGCKVKRPKVSRKKCKDGVVRWVLTKRGMVSSTSIRMETKCLHELTHPVRFISEVERGSQVVCREEVLFLQCLEEKLRF